MEILKYKRGIGKIWIEVLNYGVILDRPFAVRQQRMESGLLRSAMTFWMKASG